MLTICKLLLECIVLFVFYWIAAEHGYKRGYEDGCRDGYYRGARLIKRRETKEDDNYEN